jgi:hypothetical protein
MLVVGTDGARDPGNILFCRAKAAWRLRISERAGLRGRGLGACCISKRTRLTTFRRRGLFESIASDGWESVIYADCRKISFLLAV